MKIRQQMRKLFRSLRHEAVNVLWGNHNHDLFVVKGTGCILCRLLDPSDHPLAALQMAREKGLAKDWLIAERQMCDLLGTERFRRKIQRDMDYVKNLPKVNCLNCGGTVFVFMTIQEVARFLATRAAKSYKSSCQHCGEMVYVTENLIPSRLMRTVQKYIKLRQSQKVLKKGYTSIAQVLQQDNFAPIEHSEPEPGDFGEP